MIDSQPCRTTTDRMKILVIAGSYAQYRDFLAIEQLHELAAPRIESGEELSAYDPGEDQIRLVGTYHDNPAYQSRQYWAFQGYSVPAVSSA